MEADAVSVDTRTARPVGQPAVDPIERLERILTRRLADNRAEVAGVHAAEPGDRALLVGRDPLDLPRGQEQVGKRQRRPPEDRSRDSRPSFRPIEVHHVRKLVGEDQPQPVVEVDTRRLTASPCR